MEAKQFFKQYFEIEQSSNIMQYEFIDMDEFYEFMDKYAAFKEDKKNEAIRQSIRNIMSYNL